MLKGLLLLYVLWLSTKKGVLTHIRALYSLLSKVLHGSKNPVHHYWITNDAYSILLFFSIILTLELVTRPCPQASSSSGHSLTWWLPFFQPIQKPRKKGSQVTWVIDKKKESLRWRWTTKKPPTTKICQQNCLGSFSPWYWLPKIIFHLQTVWIMACIWHNIFFVRLIIFEIRI